MPVPKEAYPLFVFVGGILAFAGYRLYTVANLPETQIFRRKDEDEEDFKIAKSGKDH